MSKPKITAKQEGGDDGYCYVVRINGKEFVNGLTRSEVPYYKKRAMEHYEASRLRELVFEGMDAATDNGFFGLDDGVTPEDMAADMCEYNPDIEGKYTPGQVLPHIQEWLTKRDSTPTT